MSTKRRPTGAERGFTIVELMIAISVFSVILLLATVALMQIGRMYAKGLNDVHTQDAARNIVNDVTGLLKFSSAKPAVRGSAAVYYGGRSVMVYASCAGTTRYSYVIDRQLMNPVESTVDQTPHVLWKDSISEGEPCLPLNVTSSGTPQKISNVTPPSSNGKELMPDHMRLTGFQIDELSSSRAYQVQIRVAYGASDLQQQVSGSGTLLHKQCKNDVGNQFCSVVELSTIVTRRLR